MAGLTAASELFWQGFLNVVVLEGNNRIGGRIYTIPQQTGGVLEYGAQWIHGQLGNPLFRMAWNNNLLYEWQDGEERHPEVGFHSIDGELIPKQVVDRTFEIIDRIFTEAETLIDNLNGLKIVQVISGNSMKKLRVKKQVRDDRDWFKDFDRDDADKLAKAKNTIRVEDSSTCSEISFGAYVRTMFRDHLDRTEPPTHVRRWMESLYDWRMRWENTETSCPSLDDVSFPAWNDYVQPPGEMDVELGDAGYSGLFDVIMANIPPHAIHLNTHVEKIQWKNADNTVKIIAKSGRSYTADNVIVTSSLGYLKEHHRNMFEPALPLNKTAAIARLGFGVVDKILLFFDERQDSVNMAWHSTDHLHPIRVGVGEHEDAWYRALYSFNPILQHPTVMLAFIAGDEAMTYEQTVTDEQALGVCHQLLKQFSGRPDFPKPNAILRTKWFSDKYANGSYSYRRVGSTMKDSEILSEPVYSSREPAILFAGEATHPTLFSTATGAYESGQREAERITNYYTNCAEILPADQSRRDR